MDFENIFARDDDERRLWQKMVRTNLVNLALKTYEHRIYASNDKDMFTLYKDHRSTRAFTRLNLGPVGNVPGRYPSFHRW